MERTIRRDEPVSVQAVPAASLPHAERAALWTEAFSDYYAPGVVTAEALQGLERAFDVDTGASQLVLEDSRPVAFALLGIRGRRGWVGGMGVIPSARRRGHGERVMRAVLDAARDRGLATVRLEVLVQNVQAIPLYEELGFRTLRKVEVWDRAAEAPALAPPAVPARTLDLDAAAARLGPAHLESAPWQRELAGARVAFPDLTAVASDDGAAVAVFRANPERIGLLEVAATGGPDGSTSGGALDQVLATIFSAHAGRPARLLNLPEGDPAGPALERAGLAVSHRQWEMEIGIG